MDRILLPRRAVALAPLLAGAFVAAAGDPSGRLQRGLADLERRHGGRLGVAVVDTAFGGVAARRGDERFALCSTYKLLAAAFVLARVDSGQERLDRQVVYSRSALVAYSPVTATHSSLTIGELCAAAVTLSDNMAGNLLLDSFGGPAALTAYLRSLGDDATRLDRTEPTLNEAAPGDPRDTTTPAAMLNTMRRIVLGNALSAPSRARITAWLIGNTTGGERLRAGVPAGWRVGDRTGAGAHNAANGVAVLWPPGRAPIVVTAFYAESRASKAQRDAVISAVGRLAAGM